jgi:hypothetical protein
MRYAAVLIAMFTLSGCRHFVVERDAVSGLNDKQWTIQAEPEESTSSTPSPHSEREGTP